MLDFTLHVENFGMIKKADITPSAITFFIGDNNSGKSYLMTLLYGILSDKFNGMLSCVMGLFNHHFDKIIENGLSGKYENNIYNSTENDLLEVQKILNSSLEKSKNGFIKDLFNKKIPIESLRLSLNIKYSFKIDFNGERVVSENNDDNSEIERFYRIVFTGFKNGNKTFSARLPKNNNNSDQYNIKGFSVFMIQLLIDYMIKDGLPGGEFPIYLPASRTGLLLTAKPLVNCLIMEENSYDYPVKKYNNIPRFTLPVKDFFNFIASLSADDKIFKGERKRVVSFIEKNVIGEKIIINKSPLPYYLYKREKHSAIFPVQVSSGALMAVAPISMVIQRCDMGCLMIEEPEMGLHPALQKQMGRLLVQIANKVCPVIVSTYCEIIVQHVVNMAKLKNHPDCLALKKEFGYSQDDLIEKDEFAIYQFDTHDNQTTVKKLEWFDKNGIVVQTFIDSISAMVDETMKFDVKD
jgi:predicted ATPase